MAVPPYGRPTRISLDVSTAEEPQAKSQDVCLTTAAAHLAVASVLAPAPSHSYYTTDVPEGKNA